MSRKTPLAISACLAGEACSYRGEDHRLSCLESLEALCELVAVCPETAGGLPTPREPSEIRDGRVVTRSGQDVTAAFESGAAACLAQARAAGCGMALLKSKSPSCGCGLVYDGSFSGRLVAGKGVAAEAFEKAGIQVFSSDEAEALAAFLAQGPAVERGALGEPWEGALL